jgi:hypothetical protein
VGVLNDSSLAVSRKLSAVSVLDELRLVVAAGKIGVAVLVEVVCLCVARRQVNQTFDGVGRGRSHRGKRIDIRRVKSSRRSQRSEARSQSAECRKRDEDRRERKSSRCKAHAGAAGAGVSNGRGLRTGGKFTPCIQTRGAMNPLNLLSIQALGRLPETPLRHPLRGSLSCRLSYPLRCSGHRSPRRSNRCGPNRPTGCSPGCLADCFPRCSPRCSAGCSTRCSDCCGPSRSPRCSPRSSDRSSPDCPENRLPSCSQRCSIYSSPI